MQLHRMNEKHEFESWRDHTKNLFCGTSSWTKGDFVSRWYGRGVATWRTQACSHLRTHTHTNIITVIPLQISFVRRQYQLKTNFMEQTPSWEAKGNYRAQKIPPLVRKLSQMNPARALPPNTRSGFSSRLLVSGSLPEFSFNPHAAWTTYLIPSMWSLERHLVTITNYEIAQTVLRQDFSTAPRS
jgi:hypothetical protein